ncbi:DUF5074 domain-containing protein [Bacteroides sp.]|uniref:DUF5074 domain-containing protein n=1 Tax=Bacteroides sp. TaxID=29523 RepID=UPI00261EFD6C|nr:DUF5074 domain-containing protein [Bacteroides sp.]MDD3037863.1 YncE family protein [Bacteroides sp.]
MKKNINYTIYKWGKYFSLLLLLLMACDDLEDMPGRVPEESGDIFETGTAEMYILSEGLYTQNNSSLAYYSFAGHKRINNYFNGNNQRGLGDTANDMAIYGNKIYVVVNASSTVEVIDFLTGKSIRQIRMLSENGSSRQPRAITFDKDKAYVCSFDGTVAKIDTTSLEIEAITTAGRNSDDLCVQNGKLYVSNSGGLDYSGPGVDNTVSVIDIATFKEIKKIEVGPNPGKILPRTDKAEKYVYLVTRGVDIEAGDYHLVKIDCYTDKVANTYDEKVLSFAIDGPIAYLYTYDYRTKDTAIKVFNLTEGKVIRENFLTDGTTIHTPYSIQVNPYSNNIYITEAYNYTVKGDILCFNQQGQLQFRLNEIGLNPNTIVFSDRASQNNSEETPEDPDAPTAFANKVYEYIPAPGQFINTTTSAYKEGFSAQKVLEYATERLQNKYTISLGGFGGSITVGFHQSIQNVKNEYDFKIWGNAAYNLHTATGALGGSAEPGIVFVSKDVNGNGLPDDEWYELAGSEYGKDTETRGYEITYYRPQPAGGDVRWKDNQGKEGHIYRNGYHQQDSYYPNWIEEDEIIFHGTRLKDNAVNEGGTWVGYCYPWGYADNHPYNTEFCQFKIDWAVDKNGQSVKLDKIDFIRIYTAVNQNVGWTGEISTEIMTVENLHFEN